MTDTATGLIRLAFQDPTHADPAHLDPEGLVPHGRAPLRRLQPLLSLRLPPHGQGRLVLRRHARFTAACSIGPAIWTIGMIALAWQLRF